MKHWTTCAVLVLACAGDAAEVDDWDIGDDPAGKADGATEETAAFFDDQTFYMVRVDGWPRDRMTPDSLRDALSFPGARLRVTRADPDASPHCSDGGLEDSLVHETQDFSLRTSGNLTNGTPKSSYKIKFTSSDARLYGMHALNLKSMWNDVSQMREALAWHFFERAGVAGPRHSYARFCINDRYYGLYSVIEQVDKSFLRRHFTRQNDDGNLYKAAWADVGPANLTHRHSGADDSGARYFSNPEIDERTYELQTNENDDDDPAHQTYDDLATFIRTINAVGGCNEHGCWQVGGSCDASGCDRPFDPEDRDKARFDTDEYRESVEAIFDVRSFLRWAAVNVMLGAWDNYWATPSNYYLYNSGRDEGGDAFMEQPYFHYIPWDYDNSFGIDYFDVAWQRAEIVDWEAATAGYYDDGTTSNLPLIRNLLANSDFLAYYLDFLEHFLREHFNVDRVAELIGTEGSGGFWDRVRTSAFLESDSPMGGAHTGRQFTNDQVYWNGFEHHELRHGSQFILGIEHWVRMRHDEAWDDLARWRMSIGSSGATFPALPTPLPPFEREEPGERAPSEPGALVITEIMLNPAAVEEDRDGEWIELQNVSAETFNLRGCDISDRDSRAGHIIAEDLIVAPGAFVVLGSTDDPTLLGVRPHYSYDGAIGLSNSDEAPTLRCGSVLIDSVNYGAEGFETPNGAALQLDPSATDHGANDVGHAWCPATTEFRGEGSDTGTPGSANPPCR